ncbi:UDP:flavonoid glycosyltransferase YjiC (YdhE family) [Nonomuraea thailandensis]|uniref:UDP:flavonoid glycosyltransferase YjiC (YdhE family) n=1 Tax=Nonomuraea thailandensis TaxID=1188745 RepID=A0A9X2GZT9_9ACTN|nr:glycosyltransferase [Nonomuraea thailandensis]MCP2363978.1 UDP:flavonoid glycosyltransferase YjiC (YdhE family) [Nonomuraea thailandensis]
MRVAVLGLGSRGDVQPCAALARELATRGHAVTLVAPARYAGLARHGTENAVAAEPGERQVASAVPGVVFAALGVDPRAVVESEEGRRWLGSGPLGFVRGFRTVVEPLATTLVKEVDAACADADLVLAPALGAFGRHLHDRYGTPYRILHFQPSEPTREFPNPLIPRATLGPLGNRASYAVIERLGWVVLGRMVNRLRSSVLGLGPLRGSPFAADRRARVPVWCGVSPLVVPRPADWPGHVHLTGYWRLPAAGTDSGIEDFLAAGTDSGIEDFLEAGPAPVFVGFGSMVPDEGERVAAEVAGALRRARMRGVVQGLPVAGDDDLRVVGEVAHERLFPRMAAVVHHGGAGTTGTALTAGVPNVVCPFFSDQPFWGRRVAALGAGPRPLPVTELTRDELAARLIAAGEYRENAARLGRLLRVEHGVKNAADLIDRP